MMPIIEKSILPGMSTLLELDSIEENIGFCHSLSVDIMELNMWNFNPENIK